jgi:acetyl esterase
VVLGVVARHVKKEASPMEREVTESTPAPKLELAHTMMTEEEARRFLAGREIRHHGRTMDPKAQIVGEFVKSIRVPGYFPPLPELRQQLRTMVGLMDEPAPALPRLEDLQIPGPAGAIPARVYDPAPAARRPRPAVTYFHGGGWVQGDLETHHGFCARLALRSGAMVVAVDYRLAPEHKFPAAVDDCFAAYVWLRAHGGQIGADQDRIGVGGDSAGGNLAAVVAQLAAQAGRSVPACQVLIYPATDFAWDTTSHRELADAPVLPRERIVWYAEQYLRGEADARDVRASPLLAADLTGQPPAMVVTAGFDPLRDEGHAYADRLRGAGVDVHYREYEGQVHAFLLLTKVIPQGLTCTDEIGDYVRERLGAEPSPRR